MQFALGNANSDSSQLAQAGALIKGTAGTFAFNFQGMGYAGGTYTLAIFSSTTFSASDFSYTNLGWGLTGTFAIVGGTQLQFSVAPAPVVIQSGQSVAFNAPSNGLPATSVQWDFNNTPIAGATDRILLVSEVTSANTGTYACTVISPAGTTVFPFPLAVVSAANPGYLSNLSGRGFAGTGSDDGLFGGFQISGSAPNLRGKWRHNHKRSGIPPVRVGQDQHRPAFFDHS